MIGPEFRFTELERFLEKWYGQVQLPGMFVRPCKGVHARERLGMIGAEMVFAQPERALRESDRSLGRANTVIGFPHGLAGRY